MPLLFRSHLLQLIPSFALSTVILTFVLSLDTVYRLISLIIERGVGIGIVLLLLIYQLPQFVSTTLPYATLMATVLLISRLSTEFELTAMHAAGMSTWNISSPVIVFGFLITCISLLISLWITPMGYRAFEEEKIRLLHSQKTRNIQPRVLNYDFSGKVLYVQEKTDDELLRGVFFTDRELSRGSMVTASERGIIEIRKEEQDLVLHLEKGQIHIQEDQEKYRIIDFDKFHYIFRTPVIAADKKAGHVWGKPTASLWNSSRYEERRELLMRLTNPLACFAISLAMISLGIVEPRRGRTAAYLRGLILILLYYMMWMGANELMRKISQHMLWLPGILTLLYGLYNLFKVNFRLSGLLEGLRYAGSRSFRQSVHG